MLLVSISLALLTLCFVNASNPECRETSSSPGGTCSDVGSLKEMLLLINNVAYSLGELAESAKRKADIVGDEFCGNEGVNTTITKDELCLKAEPDCSAIYAVGLRKSGLYRIWPQYLNHSIRVFCDMETDFGGWTVIQRRGDYGDPPRNFFETWQNYKHGFGDIEKDFWLGNDNIFALTNRAEMTLRIDLEDFDGQKRFAKYRKFLVRSELEQYRMTFEGYEGNAGDSLKVHNGKIFITKDHGGGCAETFKGGWWYADCHEANLNGLYHCGYHTSHADGINWSTFRGFNYSMKNVEMKIRLCKC